MKTEATKSSKQLPYENLTYSPTNTSSAVTFDYNTRKKKKNRYINFQEACKIVNTWIRKIETHKAFNRVYIKQHAHLYSFQVRLDKQSTGNNVVRKAIPTPLFFPTGIQLLDPGRHSISSYRQLHRIQRVKFDKNGLQNHHNFPCTGSCQIIFFIYSICLQNMTT